MPNDTAPVAQTNTASYWLDVANVAQQAEEAADAEWRIAYDADDDKKRELAAAVCAGAKHLRLAAIEFRNALATEEASDASR